MHCKGMKDKSYEKERLLEEHGSWHTVSAQIFVVWDSADISMSNESMEDFKSKELMMPCDLCFPFIITMDAYNKEKSK